MHDEFMKEDLLVEKPESSDKDSGSETKLCEGACGNTCGSFSCRCGRSVMRRRVRLAASVVLAAGAAWLFLGNFGFMPLGDFPAVSGGRWQAIFLTNGQVYFGHLENYNRGYARLRDIYYLQAQQPLQAGSASTGLNLVKLGGELHGPEDAMLIPKRQILFWEHMKSDAQVVKAIESTKK